MKVLEDMSTNNDSQEAKKPLTLNRPKKLELKKTVETGQVRQSFSHGRTKTVQVEVKRKRTYRPGDGGSMTAVSEEAQAQAEEAEVFAPQRPVPDALRNLRPEEREARMRALEHAKEDAARREIEDAERRKREAEEAERRRLEAEERARREADEAVRRQSEGLPQETPEEARAAEAAVAAAKEAEAAQVAEPVEPMPAPVSRDSERLVRPTPKAREAEDEGPRGLKKKTPVKAPPPSRGKGEPKRRQGKLTITQALDDEGNEDRIRSLAAVRRQRAAVRSENRA
jgi:translation initiation factor IF-2